MPTPLGSTEYTPEQTAFLTNLHNQFSNLMARPEEMAYMAASIGLNELAELIMSHLEDIPAIYQAVYQEYHAANPSAPPDLPGGAPPPPPADEDLLNAGGGIDWARLNLDTTELAQRMELARQQTALGFLENIMETQRDPFSIVPALQLYGAAGGGTLAPHAALAEGGGAIQQSPYGDIAQQLIESLARFTGGTGTSGPQPTYEATNLQDYYNYLYPKMGAPAPTAPPTAAELAEHEKLLAEAQAGSTWVPPPPGPTADELNKLLPDYYNAPSGPPLAPTYEATNLQDYYNYLYPKMGKTAPVVQMGHGGTVVSNEPMIGIGAYSGNPRFMLGERGPEKMTVTPVEGQRLDREQAGASNRVKAILDALQRYSSGPGAIKRNKRALTYGY